MIYNLKIKNIASVVSLLTCLLLASCMNDNRPIGKRIDDTTLLIKVENAIHQNKSLPRTSAISVNAHGNIIQLSGFVDTQWEKDEAERTTLNVERVEGVINDIRVKNNISHAIKKKGTVGYRRNK